MNASENSPNQTGCAVFSCLPSLKQITQVRKIFIKATSKDECQMRWIGKQAYIFDKQEDVKFS
jgi:hypothetical protein